MILPNHICIFTSTDFLSQPLAAGSVIGRRYFEKERIMLKVFTLIGYSLSLCVIILFRFLCCPGEGPLMEWVALQGEGDKAPRIRIARPVTAVRYEGTRKRRRAAMGDYNWSVGDRVDALIRDRYVYTWSKYVSYVFMRCDG
jgi:hypothetical protein